MPYAAFERVFSRVYFAVASLKKEMTPAAPGALSAIFSSSGTDRNLHKTCHLRILNSKQQRTKH